MDLCLPLITIYCWPASQRQVFFYEDSYSKCNYTAPIQTIRGQTNVSSVSAWMQLQIILRWALPAAAWSAVVKLFLWQIKECASVNCFYTLAKIRICNLYTMWIWIWRDIKRRSRDGVDINSRCNVISFCSVDKSTTSLMISRINHWKVPGSAALDGTQLTVMVNLSLLSMWWLRVGN